MSKYYLHTTIRNTDSILLGTEFLPSIGPRLCRCANTSANNKVSYFDNFATLPQLYGGHTGKTLR